MFTVLDAHIHTLAYFGGMCVQSPSAISLSKPSETVVGQYRTIQT